jgi:hypothetical protein
MLTRSSNGPEFPRQPLDNIVKNLLAAREQREKRRRPRGPQVRNGRRVDVGRVVRILKAESYELLQAVQSGECTLAEAAKRVRPPKSAITPSSLDVHPKLAAWRVRMRARLAERQRGMNGSAI